MYLNLSGELTKRFIGHLQDFWRTHPQYKDLPNNIQGKYSFDERPQQGIIVKPTGSTHQRLSAQNFMGTVLSYLIHYKIKGFPGNSIEWVMENGLDIRRNGGYFPSEPGIYVVEVTKSPYQGIGGILNQGEFFVDPLIDVVDELVMPISDNEGQLQMTPISPNSQRLYQMPFGSELRPDIDYTLDFNTGIVTYNIPLLEDTWITADYRYQAPRTGPHYFGVNEGNYDAIPGAILAFGRRSFAGDKFSIIVQPRRCPSALEYGGRWSTGFEIQLFARDVHNQREMTDMTAYFLEGPLRSHLASLGILIREVSIGGESEEIYDETGQDFFYNATISMTVESEWFTWVPLARIIRSASFFSVEDSYQFAALSNEEITDFKNNLQIIEESGMVSYEDPFYLKDKNQTYALIR